jgi:Fic family protein
MLNYQIQTKQLLKLQSLLLSFGKAETLILSYSEKKRNYIKTQSMISNIGASTRIENAILTDVEIEWINTTISTEPHNEYGNKEQYIKDKLSKDKERSIEEVAGYRKALQLVLNIYNDLYPLKISDIKGLHREILYYYKKASHYIGEFKTQPNSVIETELHTGKTNIVLKTADPGVITMTSMDDLVSWFNKEINENPWPVAVVAEFIFRFLAIHPFQDGNGRLSRLLFQLALMIHKGSNFDIVLPYIALDRAIELTRGKYYYVLRKCSGGYFNPDPTSYSYEYILDYMIEVLDKSLNNLKYYDDKYEKYMTLSETALKVLNCFKEEPEKTIKTKDIITKTNIPRRTVIYALNTLKDISFIQQMGKGAGSRYKLTF